MCGERRPGHGVDGADEVRVHFLYQPHLRMLRQLASTRQCQLGCCHGPSRHVCESLSTFDSSLFDTCSQFLRRRVFVLCSRCSLPMGMRVSIIVMLVYHSLASERRIRERSYHQQGLLVVASRIHQGLYQHWLFPPRICC